MVKCLHYHSECILGLGITNYEKDTERSYFMMIYSQYFQLQQSLEGVLVHAGDLVIIQLQTPQRLCTLEDPATHRCDDIVRYIPAEVHRERDRDSRQADRQQAGEEGEKEIKLESINVFSLKGSTTNCRLNVNRYRYDTTLITYNRKRLAELVTKFSGIALSRLLFRRLIYSGSTSSRSVKVFEVWYFWCFISKWFKLWFNEHILDTQNETQRKGQRVVVDMQIMHKTKREREKETTS